MRVVASILALFLTLFVVGCGDDKAVDVDGPSVDIEVDDDGETRVNVGD